MWSHASLRTGRWTVQIQVLWTKVFVDDHLDVHSLGGHHEASTVGTVCSGSSDLPASIPGSVRRALSRSRASGVTRRIGSIPFVKCPENIIFSWERFAIGSTNGARTFSHCFVSCYARRARTTSPDFGPESLRFTIYKRVK